LFVLVALTAVGLGVWQFMRARGRADERAAERREVRQFERGVRVAEGSLQKVLTEMSSLPDQLKTGQMAAADFKVKTEEWLKALRDLDSTLRSRETPEGLQDARASLVRGVVIFIDAAKLFQLAADTPDAAIRERAMAQGRNLLLHASSVYQAGQLALARERLRVGLVKEEEAQLLENQRIPLPEEDAPSPEPAASPSG
jgi:hypothetical protein